MEELPTSQTQKLTIHQSYSSPLTTAIKLDHSNANSYEISSRIYRQNEADHLPIEMSLISSFHSNSNQQYRKLGTKPKQSTSLAETPKYHQNTSTLDSGNKFSYNVSEIIQKKLESYDIRLRPNFGGKFEKI